MKLKTLKDIQVREGIHYRKGWDILEDVKKEAIKWEKRLRFDDEEGVWNIWNQFFNIKENELGEFEE